MFKTLLTTTIALFSVLVVFQAPALARNVGVTGRGSERSFCNSNSGYFCLERIKRDSQDSAGRDAQRTCEYSRRGRSLTYTTSYSSYCSPGHLPPNHDGTWVSCNTTAYMQCEVND